MNPNVGNEFIVPNQENKLDYYVNPCLCQLANEFNTKNDKRRSFSYETNSLMSVILMNRMSLWYLIMKRKEITM